MRLKYLRPTIRIPRWLHFCLLGGVIFVIDQAWSGHQQRQLSCPTDAEIQTILQDWHRQTGQSPDPQQRERLIQDRLDQGILVREALLQGMARRDPVVVSQLQRDAVFLGVEGDADHQLEVALELGLAEGDETIRRRLQQLMMAQSRADALRSMPSEAVLKGRYGEAGLADNAVLQWRFNFEQRYFAHDQTHAAQQAKLALNRGHEQIAGESFIYGEQFASLGVPEITDKFGADVVHMLQITPIENRWFGPVSSPYGLHLLKLHARWQVKPEYRLAHWREAYIRQHWQQDMAVLRGQYRINCND